LKGFKLDSSGDIIINNNTIEMISGNELLAQTVRTLLGTNKGEWALNEQEGINHRNIIGQPKQKSGNRRNGNALEKYYKAEISHINEENSEMIQQLRDRLEGK
jgi:hypothetical protein